MNKMLHPTYQTLRNSSNIDEAWEWITRCYGLPPEILSRNGSPENISPKEREGKSVLDSPLSDLPLPGEQTC